MKRSAASRLRFCLSLGVAAGTLLSPRAEFSPLSIHSEGFGLEVSGYTARERAMGEAGMASVTKQGLSIPNPSRTAFHDKTSFTATFDSDVDYVQDEVTSNRAASFILPSIGMNFHSRALGNLGLFYHQRFHRNFSFTPLNPVDQAAVQSFRAEGGMYELAITYAYAPLPYLSVGLGYHFLLGRDRLINSAQFSVNDTLPNGLNLTGDTLSTQSNGGFPSLSMTFKRKNFSVAVAGAMGATLEQKHHRKVTHLQSDLSWDSERDLPWSAALGVAFKPDGRQTWVGDFAMEAWDSESSKLLNPSFRLGTGYEYQGIGGPYDAYYRKLAYRGGLGYERLYLEETDQYYLTVGAGLPLGRRGNLMDFALKYGHRGSLENNLWSEDFIKLSVSLTGVGIWGQPVRKRK